MPPWFTSTTTAAEGAIDPVTLIWRLGMAFVLGWVVSQIYRRTRPVETIVPTFPTTLLLLSIIIAMVTQVIGDNVARAFSLVGALSIVRFRTVVQDTQDTAFVIFAVVVGMAVGSDHLMVALAGLVIVTIALFVVRQRHVKPGWSNVESRLTIRVAIGEKPEELIKEIFERHVAYFETVAVGTVKQGVAVEVAYNVRLRPDSTPSELVGDLNRRPGIQSVEIQRRDDDD